MCERAQCNLVALSQKLLAEQGTGIMDPLHATTEEFAAGILTEIRYALRAPHRQQHRQAARAKAIGARSELRALSSGCNEAPHQ
jgi:hypothetical protein